MAPATERIVINSTSDWYEFDRARWEETRSGYVFDRIGENATIDFYSSTAPEGSPEAAWQILPTAKVAKARIGPDFLRLLCEVNRQPMAISAAVRDSADRPGWTRFGGSPEYQALICVITDGSVELALAPDEATPLETFVPESALFLQLGSGLAALGKWLPDLINHLRLRGAA